MTISEGTLSCLIPSTENMVYVLTHCLQTIFLNLFLCISNVELELERIHFSIPRWCNIWMWARQKSGSWNSIQVSPHKSETREFGQSSTAFSGTLQGAGLEAQQLGLELTLRWGASIAGSRWLKPLLLYAGS